MFTNISWGNYIIVAALLLVSWYLFVGFRFYLDEAKEIIKEKLQYRGLKDFKYLEVPSKLNHEDSAEQNPFQSEFEIPDSMFEDVESLVERLKNVAADAASRKLLKEEFIEYVRLVLTEYPTIKNSSFKSSVSEVIVSECDKLESVTLTQEEAEKLWN
ncbi:hypothetical protein [Flavobacterium aestuarii]|uniref:hypothetical protein n=1 Tax=Flavobacterium aestuarii TaxID=3149227 RepID=UPI0032B477BA